MFTHKKQWVTFVLALIVSCPLVLSAAQKEGKESEKKGKKEKKEWTEVFEKGDEAHGRYARGALKKLPEGHKLRVTYHKIWDPSRGKTLEMVRTTVPLDKKGRRDGVEKHYKAFKGLQRTVTFEAGERHGPEKIYGLQRGTDQPRAIIQWKNGEKKEKKIFYSDGELNTVVKYEDGHPVGKSRSFDREGRLQRVVPYKNGNRHGKMITYWPETGKKKRVVPCVEGVVDGVVREYYKDGSKKAELPFRDDSLHGVTKHWDEDGKLERKRYWIEGNMVPQGVFKEKFEK